MSDYSRLQQLSRVRHLRVDQARRHLDEVRTLRHKRERDHQLEVRRLDALRARLQRFRREREQAPALRPDALVSYQHHLSVLGNRIDRQREVERQRYGDYKEVLEREKAARQAYHRAQSRASTLDGCIDTRRQEAARQSLRRDEAVAEDLVAYAHVRRVNP